MKSYLGLGSNLGQREDNLTEALKLIDEKVGKVLLQSSLYYSEPWGYESEQHFVNQVVLVETRLEPLDLLHQLQAIEKEMGRKQKAPGVRYEDRIIDIDILLYDDWELDLPELKIPHPLMKERDFVQKPLNEILGLI